MDFPVVELIGMVNYDDKPNEKRTFKFNRITDAVEFIQKNYKNPKLRLLEKIGIKQRDYRMFFDLEGDFPEERIPEFFEDFKRFVKDQYNIDNCNGYYTKNMSSVHGSNSYHVYFDLSTKITLMEFVVNSFDLFTERKYNTVMDRVVYNYGRIFRVPGAIRPTQRKGLKGDNDPRRITNMNDFHEVIIGRIADCLIQNDRTCLKIPSNLIVPIASPNKVIVKSGGDVQVIPEDPEKDKEQVENLQKIKDELQKYEDQVKNCRI